MNLHQKSAEKKILESLFTETDLAWCHQSTEDYINDVKSSLELYYGDLVGFLLGNAISDTVMLEWQAEKKAKFDAEFEREANRSNLRTELERCFNSRAKKRKGIQIKSCTTYQ